MGPHGSRRASGAPHHEGRVQLPLLGRDLFDRLRMRRDLGERIFEMHALLGRRMLCDRDARPPFSFGTNRPWRKSAPAIRTYVRKLGLGTVHAEGALIAANARLRRMRRQILIAILAVRPKLQRHDLYLHKVVGSSQIEPTFRMTNFPRFRTNLPKRSDDFIERNYPSPATRGQGLRSQPLPARGSSKEFARIVVLGPVASRRDVSRKFFAPPCEGAAVLRPSSAPARNRRRFLP